MFDKIYDGVSTFGTAMAWVKLVFAIVLFMCFLIIAIKVFRFSKTVDAKATAKVTDAKCKSVTEKDANNREHTYEDCDLEVSFKTNTGKNVTTRMRTSTKEYKEDDKINIEYNSKKPDAVMVEGASKGLKNVSYFLSCVGTCVLLICILMVVLAHKYKPAAAFMGAGDIFSFFSR